MLFERAFAQSSWTKPSMVSLLSGLLTTEHGVRTREPVIPPQVELIAERFQAAGYRTGAFTTNAYLIPSAVFSEMTYEGREGFSARHGSYKFIQPLSRNFLPTGALFDLDPGEMRNVADEHPVTAAWLAQEGRRMMSRLENAPQAGEPAILNDEQRRGLEALGYLDPDGER
ncbi:MAG: sulfatase-like hydrolase/transferase [Thermoanaerobaculales bacterium]|nr:sulfatase-like hydrolase/transferase [Thermoanaerobaculales bacterium]